MSKFVDKTRRDNLKALYYVLEYVAGSKDLKLHLKLSNSYFRKIVGLTDSNYASILDNRRSITGTVIYFVVQ